MPRSAAIARRLSPSFCWARILSPRTAYFSLPRFGTPSTRRAADSEANSSMSPSSDDRSSHWNSMISAGVVNGRIFLAHGLQHNASFEHAVGRRGPSCVKPRLEPVV